MLVNTTSDINEKKISFFLILILLLISTVNLVKSEDNDTPYFTLNFLVPETYKSRIACANMIKEELSKIGIEVINHILTYGEIGPRVWAYPFTTYSYIPTYEDGGYDGLFIGYSWPIDLNLDKIFESTAIPPYGDNFYQYSNPNYDALLNQYQIEQNPTQRSTYARQLQTYLYEDLPAIGLYYNHSLMAIRDSISGIDDVLLGHTYHRAENWQDTSDQIIKYAVNRFSYYYNLFKQESYFSMLWIQPIYGSLFQKNPNSHCWEPVIASDYTISSNKLSITVDIDPNAKFSDGSQVLAEDVKYTYELLMSPNVGSMEYGYLKYWFGTNDSIEIIDPDTIKFTLTSVYNFPLSLLSYGIVDKSVVEPAITTYTYSIFDEVPLTGNVQDTLVKSCGPFMLDTFDIPAKTVKLIPNPYWNNLTASGGVNAKLNELYFVYIWSTVDALTDLSVGNIDIMDHLYSEPHLNYLDLQGLTGISGFQVRDNRHEELSINLKHPIIGTGDLTPNGTVEAAKNIRKAISYCIPRQYFIETLFEGLGAPGSTPISDGCLGFDSSLTPYAYDLTFAKTYLEKAGYGIKETETPTDKTTFSGFSLVLIMFLSLSSLLILNRKRR